MPSDVPSKRKVDNIKEEEKKSENCEKIGEKKAKIDANGGGDRLELSRIGFGCWQLGCGGTEDYWGLEFTDELAKQLVNLSAENGIFYFDTAECYNDGKSESQLSRALESLDPKLKSKVVIGSKILPNHCDNVRKSLNATLDRLNIKSIDLYMVHWPITKKGMAHFASASGETKKGGLDYSKTNDQNIKSVPGVTKAFEQLMELQREGLIKHIGVSNFGVHQLKQALATGVKIAVNQICYNLIFRAPEFEVIPCCVENGIQVICYSVLGQGLLTGRYANVEEVPLYRARTRHFDSSINPKSRHGEKGHEELLFKTIEKLNTISKTSGIGMAQLALAFPLTTQGVRCVIAGATKDKQVISNAKAGLIKIPESVVVQLREATDELKEAMGGNIDAWQGMKEGVNTSRCF